MPITVTSFNIDLESNEKCTGTRQRKTLEAGNLRVSSMRVKKTGRQAWKSNGGYN